MYRLFFLIIFSLITSQAFPQKLSYNKGGTKATNYYEEIPYQDINGKMIVTLKINGIDYKFLFDTGAPMVLNQEILTAIKAEKYQKDKVSDVNGDVASAQVVVLNHVALGKLIFDELPAVVGVPAFF